jgi:hypothetical protein
MRLQFSNQKYERPAVDARSVKRGGVWTLGNDALQKLFGRDNCARFRNIRIREDNQ